MSGGDGGHGEEASVTGAATVSPTRRRLGFHFAAAADGYFTADGVVAFLRDPLEHRRGKAAVIRDGGPDHRGPVVREFPKRNARLRAERLPACAPDRNPVEAVWSWLEWGRPADLVPDDLTDLDDWIVEYPVELEHDPRPVRALRERSDLPSPKPPPDQ